MQRIILLVDEDRLVLKSLKRSFRKLKDQWAVLYAESPQEAIGLLNNQRIDILITEVRLTQDDSEHFLRTFLKTQPHASRIVLTGYTDPNAIFKYAGLAHQLLAKPWDQQTLMDTVQRADLISGLVTDNALKQTLNRIENFPSIPTVYLELTEKLKTGDTSVQEVGDIVIRDPSLTIKLLQIVNSPYYGLSVPVTDPQKAVSLLGLDVVKGFVLTSGLFNQYENKKLKHISISALWKHSLETANIVRQIAKTESLEKELTETSYIASLLHDVGKIIIADNFPDAFNDVCVNSQAEGIPQWQAELQVLGSSHAEIGAYLLGLWGLPMVVINAVLEHHQPKIDGHSSIDHTALLHIANAFEKDISCDDEAEETSMEIAEEFIDHLHLKKNIAVWKQQICQMI